MKVHPFADRWPMLADDELADLAADIKTKGLVHPIMTAIVDGEEMLIDGRNREAACKRVGIEPRYERLNGGDPVAFIISSNAARRQMMKGALAMVVATQYPEPEEVGRGKKGVVATHFPMINASKLSHARTVIAYAPELVDTVISGGKSLDVAYEVAVGRKNAVASDDQKMVRLRSEAPDLAELVIEERMTVSEAIEKLEQRNADEAKLAIIEDVAPDLVALVREARMSVSDAMAAHTDRENKRRAAQQGATTLLCNVVDLIGIDPEGDAAHAAAELMANVNPKLWPQEPAHELTSAQLHACASMLAECAKLLKAREK